MFKNNFEEEVNSSAIHNRETCHHWIDYEIYDALPEDLKNKYISQFPLPQVALNKLPEDKEYALSILCKANHKDKPYQNIVNCKECYKKTLKSFQKKLKKKIYV